MEATARAMNDALRHRGPDDGGVWTDAAFGIGLGNRRLAIVDLSPLGHQPMFSPDERWVLVFNGEIYNFQALRSELESLGETFRGHSDTEVLLAAFVRWGVEDALKRCNGMFAFALWDRAQRRLHLGRDRLGEKPLYYGWMGQTLLFGSELKALQAHPHFRGEINRDALALLLRHNYIAAPHSIYENVCKLPPGSILTLNGDDRPSPRAFWSLREAAEAGVQNPFSGSPQEASEELEKLLHDAVGLRMIADVPLGALLSGGLDSSLVVALMQSQSSRPVRTFSIGFHEAKWNEAGHAREVARHLQTDHTELYVAPDDALAVIPQLPTLYDEPFSDSSQIPTFLVSQLARRHVTVGLSGDGGDELFAGYERYFWGQKIWRAMGPVPQMLRSAAARSLASLMAHRRGRTYGVLHAGLPSRLQAATPEKMQKLAVMLGAQNCEAMYRTLVSHEWNPQAMLAGGTEPPTILSDPAQWAKVPHPIQQMMYLDAVTYMPDDILTKVDRASMGVSLEMRVPLLDHRVAELAWRMPMSHHLDGGQSKNLLRQILYRHVPRELIDRPKMGFGVPIAQWLRGPLRDWAESLLNENRLQQEGYFRAAPVRRRWKEHLSGSHDWHPHLWNVLMFQAWLEHQARPH